MILIEKEKISVAELIPCLVSEKPFADTKLPGTKLMEHNFRSIALKLWEHILTIFLNKSLHRTMVQKLNINLHASYENYEWRTVSEK